MKQIHYSPILSFKMLEQNLMTDLNYHLFNKFLISNIMLSCY